MDISSYEVCKDKEAAKEFFIESFFSITDTEDFEELFFKHFIRGAILNDRGNDLKRLAELINKEGI